MSYYTSRLLKELPFYPGAGESPDTELVKELLSNGHTNTKYPADGFIGFHSVVLCTSNAKQMSKLYEMSFGFEEIAYRGLETNSRKIASHVVRNGNIVIEFVNTLECVDYESVSPSCDSIESTHSEHGLQEKPHSKIVNEFVGRLVDDQIKLYTLQNVQDRSSEELKKAITSTPGYAGSLLNVSRSVAKFMDATEKSLQENQDAHVIQEFVRRHGEGIINVAFEVVDVDSIFLRAKEAGATIIKYPNVISDKYGSVKVATIAIPSTDIHHTLIQNINYRGPYLPSYTQPFGEKHEGHRRILQALPPIKLKAIDHYVENYTWNQMMPHAYFYARIFGFHKYWSVDEEDVSTTETALRSIVLASSNGKIKMPINEPAKGKKRGQIEEFYDYNGGPGVQHLALTTYDIVGTVESLKRRGIEFNTTSDAYYANLRKRLANDDIVLKEDFDKLQKLHILVDYDKSTRNPKTKNCFYLLQIFTKPLHDRPTLFIEIIQRHHHNGFGKGTFKGLFESIEQQQRLRGTLVPSDH